MRVSYPTDLRSADRKMPRRYDAPGLAVSNTRRIMVRCIKRAYLLSASSFLGVVTLLKFGRATLFTQRDHTCRFSSSREASLRSRRSILLGFQLMRAQGATRLAR